MFVLGGLVRMEMRMGRLRVKRPFVGVGMVSVVVPMPVFVGGFFMPMQVPMIFVHQQVHGERH